MRKYSIIVPVYNRPDELDELLQSLTLQTYPNFEVVVVEDGSSLTAEGVVERHQMALEIQYFFIKNVGQGFARNFGFGKARGDYFVVLDSDTVIPPHYLAAVNDQLEREFLDAYGGPDRATENFSNLQKAISYAMTSFFTTGGIRGKAKNAGGAFQPRSFNMGMSRRVFQETGGYSRPYFGEDIEFAKRLQTRNYRMGLIPDAYVYHKRRGTFRNFWKQVHYFGRARVDLDANYPGQGYIKPVHAFPALFTVFCASIPFLYFVAKPLAVVAVIALCFFVTAIFLDSSLKNKSLKVGFLGVVAAFIQLFGYGTGFIQEGIRRIVAMVTQITG